VLRLVEFSKQYKIPINELVYGKFVIKVGIRSSKHLSHIEQVLKVVVESRGVKIIEMSMPTDVDMSKR
jgi:hypothetical protein